jgi:hypothetical protein
MLLTPETYRAGELDSFLNRAMQDINGLREGDLKTLREKFASALRSAKSIFGKHAFRKYYRYNSGRSPINKAIFEIWIVALAALSPSEVQKAIEARKEIMDGFSDLLSQDSRFNAAVSIGTGDSKKVRYRFSTVRALLHGVLNAHQA